MCTIFESDQEILESSEEEMAQHVPHLAQQIQHVQLLGPNISLYQIIIPEAYHFTGIENYSSGAFRMRNVYLRDGLFDYCTIAPSQNMTDQEKKERQVALSAINGSFKRDVALKLLKCYSEPYECWSSLKSRYESDSTARQMSLIDRFFSIRKNGSMDAYLVDIKEATDHMEEVEVGLLEKVIVYHTLKNLPSEYHTFKQVILHEIKPSTYLELEACLLNDELNKWNSGQDQSKALSATTCENSLQRPSNRWPQNQVSKVNSFSYLSHNQSTIYNQEHSHASPSGGSGGPSHNTRSVDKRRDQRPPCF